MQAGTAFFGGEGSAMLPLFAATIFLSAFLLFQVQPISARFIVPWFGGSAAVWTACLLFFQVALLLGYLYAHASIRWLKPRAQAIVHAVLLAVSAVAFSIIPPPTLKPISSDAPVGHILLLLGMTVGLKYFLLSTTGPLLQAWYAARRPGVSYPYRLYSLSNLGSMLALLSYPVLIEPHLSLHQQAAIWTGGYVLFALLCAGVALTTPNRIPALPSVTEIDSDAPPTTGQYVYWTLLAACASSLLLAITNYISQNLAAVPLLWVVPLSLYLLTFILCFGGKEWRWNRWGLIVPAVGMLAMSSFLAIGKINNNVAVLLPVFLVGLFLCCLLCHGELARQKPAPRYLTAFYLMISLGGALGGVFVALIAPTIFHADYELPISIAGCAEIALVALYYKCGDRFEDPAWLALIGITSVHIFILYATVSEETRDCIVSVRNFYGILQVREFGDPVYGYRALTNGTILHGSQMLDPAKKKEPTTYYGRTSGIGLAIAATRVGPIATTGQRVGIIGLGTGTCAAYGRSGDEYRYFDINPQVIQIAHTQFTYLADSKAHIEIVQGDARLSLERLEPLNLDVLAVDAFSSDSIPMHLLTREAFAIYFKHLKPTGVLCVHVSNRHVRLQPVVANIAREMGKQAVLITNKHDDSTDVTSSDWVLVTSNKAFLADRRIALATREPETMPGFRTWTDDYSNLFQVLK